MNPKPAHVTAAEHLVDLVNPYGIGEFTDGSGCDWEHLAASLDGDTAQHGRQIADAWDPTTRGLMRFAADLALNRWGADGWDTTTFGVAVNALRAAAGRPAGAQRADTVNIVTGRNTGTLIQGRNIRM